jgi:hypothetical protein
MMPATTYGRASVGRRGEVFIKTANCLDLPGELIVGQASPLISQGNPELADIAQIFAMHQLAPRVRAGLFFWPACSNCPRRSSRRGGLKTPFGVPPSVRFLQRLRLIL